MMKHLSEAEREISEAAMRAYKAAIKTIWSYPEREWLDDQFWRRVTELRKGPSP